MCECLHRRQIQNTQGPAKVAKHQEAISQTVIPFYIHISTHSFSIEAGIYT
jgi:hypothetical protein